MKTKQIKVNKAIDAYYRRHKKTLDSIFGNERSAKAHLANDVADIPSDHFSSYKKAAEMFGDYVESRINPELSDLKRAKRDAINKDIWSDQRKLNRKMDPSNLTRSGKYLGTDSEGWESEIESYYSIKNEDWVLAHVRKYQGRSEFMVWEYIDRSLI